MEVIVVLIGISLTMAGVAIAAFTWAVRSGQFDDLKLPAERIVFDDTIRR